DLGKEQLKVIVQLGHGADGGTRRAHGPALIDGDGRWNALDAFHVGLVHAVEELARVGGKTFDVAALTFSIEDVERQRRLSRTADAGDDGERVQRNIKIEILEIVLSGAADANGFFAHDFTLDQPVLFAQDAAKARAVNQIEGFLFIGKKLQRRVFGVLDHIAGLIQAQIDPPKQ